MAPALRRPAVLISTLSTAWFWAATAWSASPSAADALKLTPTQSGVDYAQPTGAEVAKCKITAQKVEGQIGWIVEDTNGLVIRKFFDTNGDNVVDRWSYFQDGLEVYRDIDADFDGRADQYRWFHTAGCRWALDNNEDGRIDQWKVISPEEVTAEVIAALATRDADRYARLALSPAELKSLGLGKAQAASVAEKLGRISKGFETLAGRQKVVPAGARWVQFSGTQPGVVPAGTDGSTKDVEIYENAVAIVEADGQHAQVPVGSLIRVGDAWRVIGLPPVLGEAAADGSGSGFFFQTSLLRSAASGNAAGARNQELLAELEQLDEAAERATTADQQAKYNARRADLIEQIAAAAGSGEERAMWLRQLADTVSAAVQSGTYPDGAKRLAALGEKLAKTDKSLVPYVKFRELTAAYGLAMQAPKPDYAKLQEEWLGNLEQFVKDYPRTPDAAEAMLQLAIAKEFAGEDDEAKGWYDRIAKGFPGSPAAKKAAGAHTRLDSVGRRIALSGESLSGSPVDLARYRGRVVLIHYWASWSDRAKADIPALKELAAKYGKEFAVIGVSLDTSRKDLEAYLAENRLPWPQIYEEGSLDSPPANQLGILTVPTMILVDQDGKVVDRNIQGVDLAASVKKLVK